MKKLSTFVLRIIMLLAVVQIGLVSASDIDPPFNAGYYILRDEAGIQQVYYQIFELSDSSEPIQMTHAQADVIYYSATRDASEVAYISNGNLWLQVAESDTPEALAIIHGTSFGELVFSEDGNWLAYTDDGVWLLDLTTRETTQILIDIPFEENNTNEIRQYKPQRFIMDAEGNTTHLTLTICMWEWCSAGILDLKTSDVQEIPAMNQASSDTATDLLVLSGGQVLMYGNNMIGGEPKLYLANSYTDISTPNMIFDAATLLSPNRYIYLFDAVEMNTGTVRILGIEMYFPDQVMTYVYFDYDIQSGQVVESESRLARGGESAGDLVSEEGTHEIALPPIENWVLGMLSHDGELLAVARAANGKMTDLTILDVTDRDVTTNMILFILSDEFTQFQWQQ